MKKKTKPTRRKEPNPTFFVLDGSIRCYEEGTMLQLHMQITTEEWKAIVCETIKYKAFIECLREIAYPILEEKWEKLDEYFRYQMEIAVSRMRNIDALLVSSFNEDAIKAEYSRLMKHNAVKAKQAIEEIRQQQKAATQQWLDKLGTIEVSDL